MLDIESLRGLDAYLEAEESLSARLREIDTEAQGRPFTDEQRAEFEEISRPADGQLARVRATIEELQIRDQMVRQAVEKGGSRVEGATSGAMAGFNLPSRKLPDNVFDLKEYRSRVSTIDELPALYAEGAKRVVEQALFPTTDRAKAQENVSRLLAQLDQDGRLARRVIETSSPLYQAAFSQYVSHGPGGLTPAMQAALQTYSDADGGYALPFTIDPTFLLTSNGAVNPMRQIARVVTIATKSWKAITTAGVTASYGTETAAATDASPTDIDDPTITPVRGKVFIPFTAEYAEDYGAAAVQAAIGVLIQDEKDVLEANKFELGTGTNEPDGLIHALVTDGTSIVTTATAHTTVLDDVDNLIADLGPRFRAKGRFLAQLSTYLTVAGFGTAGQPANSIYDTVGKTLRGYPGAESSNMDIGASTGGKNIALFGDFSRFVIVDRIGLSVEFIPQVFDGSGQPLGQRGVYARWRNSSGMLNPEAFRLLQVLAS
jgi:HK97 family phage major capsid protein